MENNNINYKKLPYYQYFIDTSNDTNNKGNKRLEMKYNIINYNWKGVETHANYEINYDEERNVIQVHFEGTKDLPDWISNFIFLPKYYDTFLWNGKKITLKVHKSWAAMYKIMKHFIRNGVKDLLSKHPTAELEVIGWSLGSGQAQLCVQDLYYNLGIKSHLFTFGSVNLFKTNIFNRHKIKKYLRSCCKEYHLFCHRNDIVTYVVPRIFGFIKIHRQNVKGKFNFFGLFRVLKYHCHYDEERIYERIIKKENKLSR